MAEEIRSGRPMGRGRGRGKQPKEPEPPRSTASAGMYRHPSATLNVGRATERAPSIPETTSRAAASSSTGLSSSSPPGEVVGRGGMRGRRRINEGECLLTKPSACATKQGTYGTRIDLQTNYFQLITKSANWSLYQYRVDFAPSEDRTLVRKGLLRMHREIIGSYIFDGTVIFTSSRLPQPMEVFSLRKSDETKIRITIRLVGELQKGDQNYIQFFNIVMRKCLGYLNLQLVGRSFYDPSNKIEIRDRNHPLNLWPGYLTSIRQCEYNILMCSEITHKVMQERTVLNFLQESYRTYHKNYQSYFKNEILGQIVLTAYNSNTYRIDDVDFSVTPKTTFKLRIGEAISYKNYYRTKYGINIEDETQPMLVSRSKPKDRRAGQAELIYLVPELCRMTGLTDEMRSDFRTMNAMATYTKLEPRVRIERLLSFNRRLLNEQNVVKELSDWGLKLDTKLTNLSGRVIPRDTIIMSDNVVLTPKEGNWDSEIRSNKMLITAQLDDWVILITQKMRVDCKELINCIKRASRGMRFRVDDPRIVELPNDRSSSYTEMLEKIMSSSNPRLVMCIVPNNALDRYSAIKKKCCVDRPCLSQVVLARTIMSKGRPNLTAATKITIQMNCKLGGAPWTVEIPGGNFMVAGFDVCHDKSVRGRDFGALVASIDRNLSRYFSAVSAHTSGEELSNDLSVNMTKAVHRYKQVNGVLPSTIIFYRDGVGEGQVPFVYEIEVEEVKLKLANLYGGDINNVKLIFIIVTKKINSRFFHNKNNAPAGTVVDDVVTNPARYDFFLVSQSGGKGTISPSGYNIIYDSSQWNTDKIQRMTYKLTQMYYNYAGAIKVPAPCQYAHKLAALVGQAIQKPPSAQLENFLYYL